MPNYGKYDTMDYKERFVKRQTDYIDRMFSRSDGYSKVGLIRRDLTTESNMPIHMFTTKSDGERKFVCHPEYPIYKGDIIDYVDGFKYLVTEQENHSTVENFGKAQKMEESISWKDITGTVRSCNFYMVKGGMGSQDDSLRLPFSDTRKQIWVQSNDYTKTLRENHRFILGKFRPYKTTAIDNFSTTGIIKLTLESDEILSTDDLPNNIAYNGETISTQTPTTGIFFTSPVENNSVYVYNSGITYDSIYTYADSVIVKPTIEIPKTLSEKVEVYEYVDGVRTTETFTFRIDNVPVSAYTITGLTSNSITIKCNEYYYEGTLVAVKSDLTEYTAPLVLKSLF